ncbi:hypothetical protein [Candidatus Arthromitus sp. SFB-mouse]|uniref:hypothetical protein n=1 Tax=Candidatus Arthromitus sp. SFB-mouse TaxID=49118 RepID=UPI0002250F1A|nr:hypothetical protein [Candidatus Arthromitus sp. SFB-mouse]AID44131.1 Hypothetical protein SFBmNL_00203 [Candidatus Arthromitus sp. SFB-mouse-NL]EGX28003.1 hypothetical protein SFBNYU_015610 [Candidatus Arthromitus sp. SFB-mouse-NYU]
MHYLFVGITAVIHGILSIFLRVNQNLSGIGINLFATSITSYLDLGVKQIQLKWYCILKKCLRIYILY